MLSALLRAPAPLRVALSSAFAAALFVPAIVITTPALADPGDVTVTDDAVEEGGTLSFTVAREAQGTTPTTWTYRTIDDSAEAPGDYLPVSPTTITFDDQTDDSVTVQVVTDDDEANEAVETIHLEIAADGEPQIYAIGTITDNDPEPTYALSVDPSPVPENAGQVTVTATLSEVSGRNLSIPVATNDDTANADDDYTALPGGATIDIPAGEPSGSVDVAITNDTTHELTQKFTVAEDATPDYVSASAGGDTVDVTITDNDEEPTVSIAGPGQVTEGGDLSFPLTLSHKSEPAVTVVADTENGTATEPDDYTAVAAETVTFAPNQVNRTLIVTTNDDDLHEVSPETLTARISAPDHAVLGTTTSAAGGIADNDTAPTVTLSPTTVTEDDLGTQTAEFTLTLSKPAGRPVTIGYATSDGTALATEDYTATTDTVTIPTGESIGEFTVDFLGDTIHEGDETMTITLSTPDSTVASGGSLGAQPVTITDNDAMPTFTVADVSEAEGDSGPAAKSFTVNLSNASAQQIDLTYSTEDDTADSTVAGVGTNDFVGVTGGVLAIPAGSVSETFTVMVNGDAVYEADEDLDVTVSPAVGETDVDATPTAGGQHAATLTLTNDDSKPSLTLNTQTGYEGTNLRVIATVSGATQVAVPLTIAHEGDTSGDYVPAMPSDYDYLAGTGTVPAETSTGVKLGLATLALHRDNTDEPQEAIEVTVSGAQDPVTSIYKINDDLSEKAPTVSIQDETIDEDLGSVTMTVTLTPSGDATSTERDIVIPWTTASGTAGSPFDYTHDSGTLTIPAGQSTGTINVPITDDEVDEVNQYFWVKLGSVTPAEAVVTDGTAKVTIFDNDGAVAPTITAPSKDTPKYVTISGKTSEGGTIDLWGAPYANGDAYTRIARTTADHSGAYSFNRFLYTGFRVFTRANGISSPVRTIKAIQLPTINATSSARGALAFTVAANPKLGRQAVQIHRQNANGAWSVVARGSTASNSTYKVTLRNMKAGKYNFRAWIGGDTLEGTLSGYSVVKRYSVR